MNEDTPEAVLKAIHFNKLSMSLGESLLADCADDDMDRHVHVQDLADDRREIARLEALLKQKVASLSPEEQEKFMVWARDYVAQANKDKTTV